MIKRRSEMQVQNSEDLKWALGLNKWGAKLLGVWPNDRVQTNNTQKYPWHVRLRVPFMIALLLFWICLPQTWALTFVSDDLSLVINNLFSNSAAFSSSLKLFFLWRSKQEMRPVVESTMSDWLRAKSSRGRQLMLERASIMRLVTTVDYSVTAISAVGFVVFPLLGIDIRLKSNVTDYGDRHLLVHSYYPFDYSKSPYFELSLGMQYLGAIFTALAITVPENYFGALVIHTSGQFEILSFRLERCLGDPDPGDTFRLPNLIRRHVHLTAIVRALECSFTYVTLAQLFGTSIILCTYGFQFIAIVESKSQQIPLLQVVTLICCMATSLLHTLLDCVVCETLATQPARDLIPVMVISMNQKPLTAGKILSLSLATFCSLMKTTAGYISMLLAVNTK